MPFALHKAKARSSRRTNQSVAERLQVLSAAEELHFLHASKKGFSLLCPHFENVGL